LVAVSHGEGRLVASTEEVRRWLAAGQVATRYVDDQGLPSMDPWVNPNGSTQAIEGLTSPDGRIFGRMGHPERWTPGLFRNVPGDFDHRLFRAGVEYFA
ncbi:MAG TPA: phosphoribosylformylglycinamidine synthase subunit PurQ, partial [Candidatus Aminicenantes bacterium]|nr:phosphoribosylformylglycinamidine synthase subunit PurQ [Candidatus Aminicenantes bacterium]